MKPTIVLLNVPGTLAPRFRKVVQESVRVFSRYFKLSKPLTVVLMYDSMYPLGAGVEAFGYPLESREELTLVLRLGVALFQQRPGAMVDTVSTTVFHELVHLLRREKRKSRVSDAVVEEGLAVFVTSSLFGTPPELWPPAKHPEAQRLWKKAKKYLNQPFAKMVDENAHEKGMPIGFYILGDYIVSEYVVRHPKLTWKKLSQVSSNDFFAFAKKLLH